MVITKRQVKINKVQVNATWFLDSKVFGLYFCYFFDFDIKTDLASSVLVIYIIGFLSTCMIKT